MEVKTFVSDDTVFTNITGDNICLTKSLPVEKFVCNYDKYVEKFPKRSKFKHCVTIDRKAMEKCWKCKAKKPITEFCYSGLYEHSCHECIGSETRFTLPLEIWDDDFDIEKVGDEIGKVETKEKNKPTGSRKK